MAPGYESSADKDVSTEDHRHDFDYEPANANIQQHIAASGNPHSVTKAQTGLANADNTSDNAKPVSAATQVALNGKENANANIQAHIASQTNPHGVDASNVGLGLVDNTSDADKPVSDDTQDALDGKADIFHDHDNLYFQKGEHVESGGTPAQAGLPITLTATGQINPNMISFPALEPQGSFTPTGGDEYPDTGSVPFGSFWIVDGVPAPPTGYTFIGGDLAGRTAQNTDIMLWTQNGFSLIASSIEPDIYFRLDGSTPMEDDLPVGGNKVTNMGDGTAGSDAVNLDQLDDGLSGKSDLGHDHDAAYEPINPNIQAHIADATIHFTQAQIDISESQINDLDKYSQAEADALLDVKVDSVQESGVGDLVTNSIVMTQAQYDGITPNATTIYYIVG